MDYTAEVSVGLRRNPAEALDAALSRLATPIEIPKNLEQVLIKPSIYDPTLVGNTHVEVVRAVINYFRELGPITIVESGNPIRSASEAFRETGYADLELSGVSLLDLSGVPVLPTKMPGHFFIEHDIPEPLRKRSFFINVPTVKIEPQICSIGAGIKNLFGLLPEVNKDIYHSHIHSVLLDLLTAFRPHLTVVDLTSIVIGDRTSGKTEDIGAIIVGCDPVAVDAFCSDLLGISPLDVPYLKQAYALKLGEILLDRIRISGTEHQKEKLFSLCRR
jgi:uncharacterized protein (DUF362 family)